MTLSPVNNFKIWFCWPGDYNLSKSRTPSNTRFERHSVILLHAEYLPWYLLRQPKEYFQDVLSICYFVILVLLYSDNIHPTENTVSLYNKSFLLYLDMMNQILYIPRIWFALVNHLIRFIFLGLWLEKCEKS